MSGGDRTSESLQKAQISKRITQKREIAQSIESDINFDKDTSKGVGKEQHNPDQRSEVFGQSRQDIGNETLPFVSNPGTTIPEVTDFEPRSGFPGIFINVFLRSSNPIELNPGPKPSLIFGGQQIPSQLWSGGRSRESYEYTLTANVPHMAAFASPTIFPLYLSINDATQNIVAPISVGNFEYWLPLEHQPPATLQSASRKRSASPPSMMPNAFQVKRVASQTFPEMSFERPIPPAQYYDYQSSRLTETQQLQQVCASPSFTQEQHHPNFGYGPYYNEHYVPPAYQRAHQSHPTLRQSTSVSHFAPGRVITEPSRQFNPVGSTTVGSPGAGSPVNIRTSFLRRPTSRPKLRTHVSNPHFNPYSIPKATLQIEGNLSNVLENWTAEEHTASRRIVEFDRHQTGSVITASFRVVSRAEWDPARISVNCIWWEERKEAFITSVDMISLLESIMALRFTLQEKNRIRRNLEGFRPLTVGKSKPEKEPLAEDVEEFFKTIMGLDEPRPRSIEKDVKVFPWSNLTAALTKVVDKYSASYASTAGTMTMPSASPRNLFNSSRRVNAPHSESTSSPARSLAHDADASSSPRKSPRLSEPATSDALAAFPREAPPSHPLFSEDLQDYWQAPGPEDSAYQLNVESLSAYHFPTLATSNAGFGAMQSPAPHEDSSRFRMSSSLDYPDATTYYRPPHN